MFKVYIYMDSQAVVMSYSLCGWKFLRINVPH